MISNVKRKRYFNAIDEQTPKPKNEKRFPFELDFVRKQLTRLNTNDSFADVLTTRVT